MARLIPFIRSTAHTIKVRFAKNRMHLATGLCLILLSAASTPASAFTVSGHLTTPSGAGVSNIQACLYQASPYVFKCSVTDSNGLYSINSVNSGTYRLDLQMWGTPNVPTPTSFSITGAVPSTSVSSDKTLDYTLPFATMSGMVFSTNWIFPASGATISTNNGNNTTWTTGGTTYTSKSSTTVATDGSGTYSMVVLKYNNYSVTGKMSDGTFATTTVTGADLTNDNPNVNIIMPMTTYIVGRVYFTYQDENPWWAGLRFPVGNIQVCAYRQTPYFMKCALSEQYNTFTIPAVPSGTYRIDVKNMGTPVGTWIPMPDFSIVGHNPSFTVGQNGEYLQIDLPHVVFKGHVTESTGAPVGGASVTFNRGQNTTWTSGGTTYTTSGASLPVSYSGLYQAAIIPGSYQLAYNPPNGSSLNTRNYTASTISTPYTMKDVTLTTAQNYQLTVNAPIGFVQSGTFPSGDSIYCGNDGTNVLGNRCTASVDAGSQVTLTGDNNPSYCPGCVFNWTTPCDGTSAKACSFTMPSAPTTVSLLKMVAPVMVNILFEGGGGGSIHSVSSLNYGLNCLSTDPTCTGAFKSADLPVTFVATPDVYSSLVGYSGDCTPDGKGGCAVSASYPDSSTTKTVHVQMSLDVNPKAKIGQIGYPSAQLAYDAAVDGDTIMLLGGDHTGSSLLANRAIAVTINGGYDSVFATVTGDTTLNGSIERLSGTVYLNRVYSKP